MILGMALTTIVMWSKCVRVPVYETVSAKVIVMFLRVDEILVPEFVTVVTKIT
jgi:hypothetical protein